MLEKIKKPSRCRMNWHRMNGPEEGEFFLVSCMESNFTPIRAPESTIPRYQVSQPIHDNLFKNSPHVKVAHLTQATERALPYLVKGIRLLYIVTKYSLKEFLHYKIY